MTKDFDDLQDFLSLVYKNVKDTEKRNEIIKLYFKEKDDESNNFGDC